MNSSAATYATWSQQIYPAFDVLVFVLLIAFPFAVLFGLFENRKNENYFFRTKRFLAVIVCLTVLSFVAGIVIDLGIANLMTGASKVAETADLSNRAYAEFRIRNEAAMFPEVLTDQALSCYRTAFSNYVEDQWNERVHNESCNGKEQVCASNETAYYDELLKTYPRQNLANDLSAIGTVLGSIWLTAADTYKLIRRFQHRPDKEGHIPDPPDEQMLANYQHYLNDCSSLKPLPWVMPGQELLMVRPHLCFGSCQ